MCGESTMMPPTRERRGPNSGLKSRLRQRERDWWLMVIFYFGICATLLASILGCRQIDAKASSSAAEPSASSGVSLGNEPLLLAEMPQFITSWYPSRVPVFLTDDGTIHAVWNSLVENDEEPNVMYACKTPAAARWSAPRFEANCCSSPVSAKLR